MNGIKNNGRNREYSEVNKRKIKNDEDNGYNVK
jgi:hypothetical protein